MANPHAGEVSLTLAGRPYTMRPSFGAMVELEEALGCGVTDLASAILAKGAATLRTSQMAAIIWAGLKGAGTELSRDEVGTLVVQTGLAACIHPASQLLANMLTGGQPPREDSAGEAMAAAGAA
ncbi:gene transfer agent family protein [Oleisolibacter albus]|uniref:gene transfer agent family protein n=1 Tax=Oleisolibacter albus TaxID=2171757 RepID=UPI000DF440C5|nr:gene transfer agent family protein [Oleisolibacter albus]